MTVRVHQGDCRAVLAAFDESSIDACVTDPPYHLTSIVKRFGAGNAAAAKVGATGAYARASRGFMGQTWDGGDVAFQPETWEAVYRVLKPGAHLIAFSGTRTYHRMVCAIEDAGFEIRDQLAWMYGSGFPKSHDVAKGIAKRRLEDVDPMRVVCRFLRAAMDAKGLKSRDLTQHFNDCNPQLIDHWAARDTDSQPALPTAPQWDALVDALDLAECDGFEFVAREWARLNGRKGTHGERWADAEVIGEVASTPAGFGDLRFEGDRTIRSLDDEAREWDGWGTALKPALEPICLTRKPISEKSIAANVLRWGTGALNIDACRVGESGARNNGRNVDSDIYGKLGPFEAVDYGVGRWPANVLHNGSDEVLSAFPDSAGQQGVVTGNEPSSPFANVYGDMPNRAGTAIPRGDSGSAARFFYSAKAGPLDRMGSEHPTVKPVDLMRWLCRLVTPTGGTILDPFAGSGTTGIAAMAERLNAEMIDLEPKHVADIERKLALLRGEGRSRFAEQDERKAKHADPNGMPLFGAAA